MNGLIACCRPTPAPTQDQEPPLESTSALGEPGDVTKSCEEQGGTREPICPEGQQPIHHKDEGPALIFCCARKPTPTQDQEPPLESTSAPGEPGDVTKSCEEQEGIRETICPEGRQPIHHKDEGPALIFCCARKPTPTQDQKPSSPESTSAQGRPGDKKESCEKQL
ncbi:hypothetical protein J3458_015147 [Metarhizium acridum]|uniref:uncharacterized protein n=1 Tax=Metarhizium acridum TaxID=92637 RepID=UPI001C6CC2E1|nr:hypothetical protein J3458_015147 [Metarhizium acridum]